MGAVSTVDPALTVQIEADDRARLWRATIHSIGLAAEASTLPNLLRALADAVPSIAMEHGRDWTGYHDTLPHQMRGDYW